MPDRPAFHWDAQQAEAVFQADGRLLVLQREASIGSSDQQRTGWRLWDGSKSLGTFPVDADKDFRAAREAALWPRIVLLLIEVALSELVTGATIASEAVDRTHELSLHSTREEELHAYRLFRIQPEGGAERARNAGMAIGVTTKAIERLTWRQIQTGLRRAIGAATRDAGKRKGDRFILTCAEVIVRESAERGRR